MSRLYDGVEPEFRDTHATLSFMHLNINRTRTTADDLRHRLENCDDDLPPGTLSKWQNLRDDLRGMLAAVDELEAALKS